MPALDDHVSAAVAGDLPGRFSHGLGTVYGHIGQQFGLVNVGRYYQGQGQGVVGMVSGLPWLFRGCMPWGDGGGMPPRSANVSPRSSLMQYPPSPLFSLVPPPF